MVKTISATKARIHFGELMRQVSEKKETVIVERAGKPQVVVLSINEFERLQSLDRRENWLQALQNLESIGAKVEERRRRITVPEPESVIREMREEGDDGLRTRLR